MSNGTVVVNDKFIRTNKESTVACSVNILKFAKSD
jgi:hypothetical protein